MSPRPANHDQGVTLTELLFTMALAGIIMLGINGLVGRVYDQWRYHNERQELLAQGNFAMARLIQAVNASRRVLIPLPENPLTPTSESQRALLAVTLDPGLDRDADGFADGDNDKDGLIDEDIPADNTFDGFPGIKGVDDDHDGVVDENIGGADWYTDNDEDGVKREDQINGMDDDLDGAMDEDIPKLNSTAGGDANNNADNDGDGLKNEDWLDPVVYRLSADGKQLLERLPNLNPSDGAAYTEQPLVEAETITFTVQRLPLSPGARTELLEVTLLLSGKYGGDLRFATRLRTGGGR